MIVVAWKTIKTLQEVLMLKIEHCCDEEGGSGSEEEGWDIAGGGFAEDSMHPPFRPARCEVEQISCFLGSQLVQGLLSLTHMQDVHLTLELLHLQYNTALKARCALVTVVRLNSLLNY